MNCHLSIMLLLGLLIGFLSASNVSNANTVTTFASQNCWEVPTTQQSNTEISSSGTITSEVACGGIIQSSATSSIDGSMNVFVFNRDGSDSTNNTAKSSWTGTLTNNSQQQIYVEYNLLINGFLSVYPLQYEGHTSQSSYEVYVFLNGVNIWDSSASLNSISSSVMNLTTNITDISITKPVVTGEDLKGVFNLYDSSTDSTTYEINNYLKTLQLGTLSPGETFILETYISTTALACEQMANGTYGSISLSGKSNVTPVPLPSSALLLSSALVCLSAVGRRKEDN